MVPPSFRGCAALYGYLVGLPRLPISCPLVTVRLSGIVYLPRGAFGMRLTAPFTFRADAGLPPAPALCGPASTATSAARCLCDMRLLGQFTGKISGCQEPTGQFTPRQAIAKVTSRRGQSLLSKLCC